MVVPGKDGRPARVRINARLIAAGTDSQIWAQQFERSLGDTLALQCEVARAIAEGVRAVLTPAERDWLEQARPTSPPRRRLLSGAALPEPVVADGHRAVEAFRRAANSIPSMWGRAPASREGLLALGFPGCHRTREARALALIGGQSRPWRSTGNRARPRPCSRTCGSTTTGTGRAPMRLSAGDRAQHELCERALAVCALSRRGRPGGGVHRRIGAGGRARPHVGKCGLDASVDALLCARLRRRARAIGNALQLEPESASAYSVLSRIEAARGRSATRWLQTSGRWRSRVMAQRTVGRPPDSSAGARRISGPARAGLAALRRRIVSRAQRVGSPSWRSFTRLWANARARWICWSRPSASASPTCCGWPSTRELSCSAPSHASSRC